MLPPAAPGRSALPAFLTIEARLSEHAEAAKAQAAAVIADAEAEAGRIRAKGEERLQQVVLDAEAQAKREAEARARDRISDVRVKTQRWIEGAEEAAQTAVAEAVRRLTGGGESDAR